MKTNASFIGAKKKCLTKYHEIVAVAEVAWVNAALKDRALTVA